MRPSMTTYVGFQGEGRERVQKDDPEGHAAMTKALSPPDYAAFLASLKERILQARTSAARAVNRELILLYWDIGRGIVEKQQTAGWGEAVVERLAADLRAEFPDMGVSRPTIFGECGNSLRNTVMPNFWNRLFQN